MRVLFFALVLAFPSSLTASTISYEQPFHFEAHEASSKD